MIPIQKPKTQSDDHVSLDQSLRASLYLLKRL